MIYSGSFGSAHLYKRRLVAAITVLIAVPLIPKAQDVGVRGPSFAGAGATPTESKPESKLWFNDGRWWGSLWSTGGDAFHIHLLDSTSSTWIDTSTAIDARPNSHSDALWDGSSLYVASHEFTEGAGSSGNPIRIYRYGYDVVAHTYALDAGFPVTIGDSSTESLVIDKDSTGTLWAVWMEDLRVRISHTLGDDATWSNPIVLPPNTSDVGIDDICSVIHFGGDRIGVLWSDHSDQEFWFTTHLDGTPATAWTTIERPLPGEVDDHINLAADGDGRVFAVVKTAGDEIMLLVRTNGSWQDFQVGANGLTRPIVLLNGENRIVHVFGRSDGTIFEKTSSMDAINFGSGPGTVVMEDDNDRLLNNPTSMKQNVDASTGVVVLAAHETTDFYWCHQSEVPDPPSGVQPHVTFYNGSGINDGGFSSPAGPSIGQTWTGQLTLAAADLGVVFIGMGGQASPGMIMGGIGELLCLPPYEGMSSSTTEDHQISVPSNPALLGSTFALQGARVFNGESRIVLLNALMVTIGN